MVVSKKLVRERFSSNLASYHKYAFVQEQICRHLCSAVRKHLNTPIHKVLEVGAGTGFMTRELSALLPDTQWYVNDLMSEIEPFIESVALCHRPIHYCFGDAEKIELPRNLDLVVSTSALQWFDDVPNFIRSLDVNENGLLVLSTFGKSNFREIRATIGVGLVYSTLEELCRSIEAAGYEVLHREEQQQNITFASPLEVLRHIKLTGVNSVNEFCWTRGKLNKFCDDYLQLFSEQESVTLTYNPLIVIARKK